jgi:hypothetical protein
MATATVSDIKKAAKTKKPAKGANFASKRERKLVRKSMISGWAANQLTDAKIAIKERQEFYKNLRNIKMARRNIAREFAYLADLVHQLPADVRRIDDRYKNVEPSYVGEALQLSKSASTSVSAAADQMWNFSRARVFFTEAVGS